MNQDNKEMNVEIDNTPKDCLTVKFWRDGGYNGKPCPPDAPWIAEIGVNIIEGCGGSGATPLAALIDLAQNIGKDEDHRTDNGRVLLR